MKTWTKQAESRLEEYIDARARRDGLVGSDIRELREDLSAHVYEEAEGLDVERIGSEDVEKIIAGLESGNVGQVSHRPLKKGWRWAILFGVAMPLVVAILEILTGFCGGAFFDPVPTFWHSALVLSVPLLNWWLLTKGRNAGALTQGIAAGVSMVVAAFYGLLFLPLFPISVLAILAFGMGLLSLTPVFAALASWRVMVRSREGVLMPWVFKRGLLAGAAAAALVLFALEAPSVWTRYQLSRAVSEDVKTAEAGLGQLRRFHLERTLLRACYERNTGMGMATDISGWVESGWKAPVSFFSVSSWRENDSAKSRDVFFRATGKPFNSVKPPRMSRDTMLSRGRGSLDEFEFDDHLGGDQVAVRLKNLDLAESRFDGHVDSISRIGYGEWTMVFKNSSTQVKEARCQVRLPRGGKVSRLTLWINGEPREAAFNSVSKVKAAYKSVAVVQRRDPVLVTMAGPDTVLVQCFPVPANGEMKIRFGVTAPLDGRRWEMPRVVERNFGVAEGAEHALWLQADGGFEISGGEGIPGSVKDGEGFSSNAMVGLGNVLDQPVALRLGELPGEREPVWCEDRFAEGSAKFLQRIPTETERPAVDRLVVVVDGSYSMDGDSDLIGRVLGEIFPKGGIELIIANDGAVEADLETLSGYEFTGGRDNQAALRKAVSMAKEGENGAVVWLHGPQAVELSKSESLLQLLERGTHRPVIYDVEMVSGPNRLADKLGQAGVLQRGPTLFDKESELSDFLSSLMYGSSAETATWERRDNVAGLTGKKVWDHLARIWAMERSESDDANRAQIAAKYQLVTPVSGAVVLETMQQYKDHGLEPVDASAAPSIPGVPEPSTWLLFVITAAGALMRRKREC